MSETESKQQQTQTEYIEEKFAFWNEKYNIPYNSVFIIRSLFELEYQFMMTPLEHVKTKRDILDMIQKINQSIRLNPKIECAEPMYIDCIWTEGRDSNKVLIYVDRKLVVLDPRRYQQPVNIKSYANMIHDMAFKKGYEIYVNTQGFGMGLYDCLMEFGDLKVCELVVSRKG